MGDVKEFDTIHANIIKAAEELRKSTSNHYDTLTRVMFYLDDIANNADDESTRGKAAEAKVELLKAMRNIQ